MGRKRVQHELIPNESTRKVTFKKRKVGLQKKLTELTTLCGVIACAVVYSSLDHRLEIWPSSPQAATVLDEFNNSPTKRRRKYMMDRHIFLTKNISMLRDRVLKQRERNRGLRLDLNFAECLAGKDLKGFECLEDLREVGVLLEEKIELIATKIDECQNPSNNNNGKKCITEKGGGIASSR